MSRAAMSPLGESGHRDRASGAPLLGIVALLLLAASLGAQVSYNPQPIPFGAVKLGTSSPILSSTLTNTGTDTLKFVGGSSMTGSSAFHYVTDNCLMRPPGTSCVLQYRFTPTQAGPVAGANVVQTNHGPFPLNFTGTGVDTVTPSPSVVTVTSVAVAPVTVTLAVGEFTVQLYGFRAFSTGVGGATVATLLWSSSDTTVVKVAQGMLTPIGPGTATVTASDSSRTVSAMSVVTVLAQRQVSLFGQPVWTGASTLPVTDSTGKITARLLLVVRAP